MEPTSNSFLASRWVLSLPQRQGSFPGPQSTLDTWSKINSTCWKALTAARCTLGDDVTWACHTATLWLVKLKRKKPQRCVPLGSDEAFFCFPSGKWRLCVRRPVSRIHLLPSFNGVINKEKSLDRIKNTAPNSHVTSVYEKEASALLSKSWE